MVGYFTARDIAWNKSKPFVDLVKRPDGLYNVWIWASMVIPSYRLRNYSSKWLVMGVTKTFDQGMTLAGMYFAEKDFSDDPFGYNENSINNMEVK